MYEAVLVLSYVYFWKSKVQVVTGVEWAKNVVNDEYRVSEESNGFPDGSPMHWPEAVGDGGWVSKNIHRLISHH